MELPSTLLRVNLTVVNAVQPEKAYSLMLRRVTGDKSTSVNIVFPLKALSSTPFIS